MARPSFASSSFAGKGSRVSKSFNLSLDESSHLNDKSILCAGWMSKQGHFRKNWKERYFVLGSEGTGIKKRSSIFYFKSKWAPGDDQMPLGAFPLHGATLSCKQPPSDKPQPWYYFEVWTCFDQVYPLRIRSERERELWKNQIIAAINNEEAPDLDRSDAAVLDGTKLDFYQVPEVKVRRSLETQQPRIGSHSPEYSEPNPPPTTGRRMLPRSNEAREENQEHGPSSLLPPTTTNSSIPQSSVASNPIPTVPAVAVAPSGTSLSMRETPEESESRLRIRKAKLAVLEEWLFNADLGHLCTKIRLHGVLSLEDLTSPNLMNNPTLLSEVFELGPGAWEIERIMSLQEMVLDATAPATSKRHSQLQLGQSEINTTTNSDNNHDNNNNSLPGSNSNEESPEETKMLKKALYLSSLDHAEELFNQAANSHNVEHHRKVSESYSGARFLFEKALAVAIDLNAIETSNQEMDVDEVSLKMLRARIESCRKSEEELFFKRTLPTKKSKPRLSGKDDDDEANISKEEAPRNSSARYTQPATESGSAIQGNYNTQFSQGGGGGGGGGGGQSEFSVSRPPEAAKEVSRAASASFHVVEADEPEIGLNDIVIGGVVIAAVDEDDEDEEAEEANFQEIDEEEDSETPEKKGKIVFL